MKTISPALSYGDARLRLGVMGVGFWVIFSAVALGIDAPQQIRGAFSPGTWGSLSLLALYLAFFVSAQLPFDAVGGYVLPRRFERRVPDLKDYAMILTRGVAAHAVLLAGSALVLFVFGGIGGVSVAFAAGLVWIGLLAAARGPMARVVARLPRKAHADTAARHAELLDSTDEGFTGGIGGFLSPGTHVLPAAWKASLAPDQFEAIQARRAAVAASGAWRSGRWAALLFTATGLLVSLLLAGPQAAGTAVGVVETSLWFTLWSFAGLLTLPTLSRMAVYRIDQRQVREGLDPQRFILLADALDRLQDGQPSRRRWVERIFHPIPSVSNRTGRTPPMGSGCWDVARTSVFLGVGALSLLTRSVHCNVGRPALWVWLPTD